jgi:hypothetical protein
LAQCRVLSRHRYPHISHFIMNRALKTLFVIACASALSAPAQQDTSAPPHPATPPSFEIPKHDSDPENAAIPPGLRAKFDDAVKSWKSAAAAEFRPEVQLVHGRPTVILFTDSGEKDDKRGRRLRSAIDACEFLVADDTFDRVVICTASVTPKKYGQIPLTNVIIQRSAFSISAKKAGKSDDVKAALGAVKMNHGALQQLCSDLGLN